MLIGGAFCASDQLYVKAAGEPTAPGPMLTTLNFKESPRHMAGKGGVAPIVNCGTTVTHIIADPEHADVFPVTV